MTLLTSLTALSAENYNRCLSKTLGKRSAEDKVEQSIKNAREMSYGTVEQPKFAFKLKLYCIWNLYAAADCRIGNLKAEHLRWHQRLNYCNTEESKIASRIGRFILVSFGWQATKTVEEVMIVCLSLWRRTINCQMPLYHSKPLLYSAADTPWQPLCVYLYFCNCICAHVFVIVNMYL